MGWEHENDLTALRDEIDRLDEEMLSLLSRRARAAQTVGKLKGERGLPILDVAREGEVLARIAAKNPGPLPGEAVRAVFCEVIAACRALQEPVAVAYLGPPGTFSHEAARARFGSGCNAVPVPTVAEVFREVEAGRAAYGIVPVENSTEGAVGATLDALAASSVLVCGEVCRPIAHALLSRERNLAGVREVLSHPQALGQCRAWLSTNLPGRALIETASTAEAAKRASETPGVAAIGASSLAAEYGLSVLSEGIQDAAVNLTRFLVVGFERCPQTGRDKTSLLVTAAHKPGALAGALAPFAAEDLSLTRIESRPMRGRPWEYVFFLDVLGHAEDAAMQRALAALRGAVLSVSVLGSYPEAPAVSEGRGAP